MGLPSSSRIFHLVSKVFTIVIIINLVPKVFTIVIIIINLVRKSVSTGSFFMSLPEQPAQREEACGYTWAAHTRRYQDQGCARALHGVGTGSLLAP